MGGGGSEGPSAEKWPDKERQSGKGIKETVEKFIVKVASLKLGQIRLER